MSAPEAPATTDIERLIAEHQETQRMLGLLVDAVNGFGANLQWAIDNVKGIFEMFSNPAFMSMLPQMMTGGIPNADEGNDGPGDGADGE